MVQPRHTLREWGLAEGLGGLMAKLSSQIDVRSEAFRENAQFMQVLVDDLRARHARVAEGGGKRAKTSPARQSSGLSGRQGVPPLMSCRLP